MSYCFTGWNKIRLNYSSAIPPNGQQHNHWMQACFKYVFCTFTSLFPVSIALNIIINDPFFIACDNSVQFSFSWHNSKEIATNMIKLVLVCQRISHPHVWSISSNGKMQLIFKVLTISSIKIFGLFLTLEGHRGMADRSG